MDCVTVVAHKVLCGRTKLTIQAVFQSVADRDGMLQGDMEEGVSDTYNRLAELLKKRSRNKDGYET